LVVFSPLARAKGLRRSTATTRPSIENSTRPMSPVAFARHGTTPRSGPLGTTGSTLSFWMPA
jgi:hypothetical protein